MKKICGIIKPFYEDYHELIEDKQKNYQMIVNTITALDKYEVVLERLRLREISINNLGIVISRLELLFEGMNCTVFEYYNSKICIERAIEKCSNAYQYLKRFSDREVLDESAERISRLLNSKKMFLTFNMTNFINQCQALCDGISHNEMKEHFVNECFEYVQEKSGPDLREFSNRLANSKRKYLSIVKPLNGKIKQSPNYVKFKDAFDKCGVLTNDTDGMLYVISNTFSEYRNVCTNYSEAKLALIKYKQELQFILNREAMNLRSVKLTEDSKRDYIQMCGRKYEDKFKRYENLLKNFEEVAKDLTNHLGISLYKVRTAEKDELANHWKFLKQNDKQIKRLLADIINDKIAYDISYDTNDMMASLDELSKSTFLSNTTKMLYNEAREKFVNALDTLQKKYNFHADVFETERFAIVIRHYQIGCLDLMFDEDLELVKIFKEIRKDLKEVRVLKQKYTDKRATLCKNLMNLTYR